MSEVNHERLLRAIRCLQLIQRTNAPKSTIFKAASKALAPLMVEQATMPPLPGRPAKRAHNFTPPVPQKALQAPGDAAQGAATLRANADLASGYAAAVLMESAVKQTSGESTELFPNADAPRGSAG